MGFLGVLQFVTALTKQERGLRGERKNKIDFIERELEMIQEDREKHEDEGLQLQLQELVYDIEDFKDGLWVPGVSGHILTAIGLHPGPQEDLRRIEQFKERLDSLRERQRSDSSQSGGRTARSGISGSGSPSYTSEDELVGIAEPIRELRELLGGQPPQQRVISIVGCRGLGKTALARAVYENPAVAEEFPRRAWFVASECNDAETLAETLVEVRLPAAGETASVEVRAPAAGETASVEVASHVRLTELHDILMDNRYLVVIDDMQQAEMWKHIKPYFPRSGDTSSRIIVTTSVHSVANACSSGSYVYTMRGLDDACSKELFWRKDYGPEEQPAPALVDGSKSIIDKCGGLPLALLSAANCLGQNPTRRDCEDLGKALGDYLAGNEPAFGEMKRALVQCYDSLPDYGHKTCLLSLSIFPRGPRMNKKSLVRRWIAEGLVKVRDVHLNEEQIACQRLKELIDRSIIDPVLICNGSNKVVPIMLEFIIHKSISKNVVTLIHEDKLLRNKNSTYHVRRLSVQSSPNLHCDGLANGNGLCAVRSLTIFDTDLLNFNKCKLLRVLDLESCRGLDKRVLDNICDFQFLKYLSLRGSDVPSIPRKIEKLYNLETLDIRETRVRILPVEVIMLPNLVYLLGKFELPSHKPWEKENKLTIFLSKKSKLHTLAGFVINRTQGFKNVMLHAKMLKKVKVWFEPAPSSIHLIKRKFNSCFEATRKRIRTLGNYWKPLGSPERNSSTEDPLLPSRERLEQNVPITSCQLTGMLLSTLQERFTSLESLSIDSSDLSKEFLRSLQAPCAIRTIKLRGILERLPHSDTLRQLRNLNKLHLFSTGLSGEVLSELQTLRCLEYLKLAEDREGFSGSSFVVHSDGFQSLQRLCFEAPRLPLLQIEQRAMTKLTSLQMLCQEFAVGLGVTGIEHLKRLHEVILHSSTSDAVMQDWKAAAIQHQNRPSVKKQVKQPINDAA